MYHNVYWLYIGDYQNGHATGVALGVAVEVAGYSNPSNYGYYYPLISLELHFQAVGTCLGHLIFQHG